MNCTFQIVDDMATCTACQMARPYRGRPIVRTCRPGILLPLSLIEPTLASLPCTFRGPQLRTEGGCCGNPGKAVFACMPFVECTLADHALRVDGDPSGDLMGACSKCQKRQAEFVTELIAVEVSGLTDDECTGCSAINGTYVLTSDGSGGYAYTGAAGSAICICIKLDSTGALTFTIGVRDCRDRVDARYLVDPLRPLQLDTGDPNTLAYLQGSIDGAVQQCDWTAATITITGILS